MELRHDESMRESARECIRVTKDISFLKSRWEVPTKHRMKILNSLESIGDHLVAESAALPIINRHGIYFLLSSGSVVYVGQSRNVLGRIGNHISFSPYRFDEVRFVPVHEDLSDKLCIIEKHFIDKFRPKYNRRIAGPSEPERKILSYLKKSAVLLKEKDL